VELHNTVGFDFLLGGEKVGFELVEKDDAWDRQYFAK